MKQFLYLDDDLINSIIAQNEKGLIGSMTTEKDDEHGKERSKTLEIEAKGEAGANILKLAKAEAALSLGMEFQGTKREQTTTREIIAKTLHDAAFDIAYDAIKPVMIKPDTISVNTGDYVEVVRTFDFVDLEYLERIFSKGGITDYLKKQKKKEVCDGDITIIFKAMEMKESVPAPNNTQATPNNTQATPSGSEELEMMILDYLKSNPITSQANVAKGINKNVNAVKSAFTRLKKSGKIDWDGKNNQNGRWIIKG